MPSYGYLVAIIPYAVIWLFCYLSRKDVRREMLWVSYFMAVASFFTAYWWWTKDWWHPLTITGTRVGIEDVLLGFFSGGIMAGAFHVFSREHVKRTRHVHIVRAKCSIFFALVAIAVLFHFGFTSFWASTWVMVVALVYILKDRPDLITSSFVSGTLMVLCSVPGYLIALSYGHSVIQKVYDFRYLSGHLIIGIPIEEFVFWFLAGSIWGTFYEWMRGFRFVRDRA